MIELSILQWGEYTEFSGPDVTIRLLIRRRQGGHNQRRCDHESRERGRGGEGKGRKRGMEGGERERMENGMLVVSRWRMGPQAKESQLSLESKKQGDRFCPGAPRRDAVPSTV